MMSVLRVALGAAVLAWLGFTLVFAVLSPLVTQAFQDLLERLYLAVTTATTVGLGDVVPQDLLSTVMVVGFMLFHVVGHAETISQFRPELQVLSVACLLVGSLYLLLLSYLNGISNVDDGAGGLYYILKVLSTVGYGDMYPTHYLAKVFTMVLLVPHMLAFGMSARDTLERVFRGKQFSKRQFQDCLDTVTTNVAKAEFYDAEKVRSLRDALQRAMEAFKKDE